MASTNRSGAVILAIVGSTIDDIIRFTQNALRLKERPTRSTVRKRIAIHGRILYIEATLISLAKFNAHSITNCDGVFLIADRHGQVVFDEFCGAMGVCYNAGLPARLIVMTQELSEPKSLTNLDQTRQIIRAAESFTIGTFVIQAQSSDLAQACLASLVTFVLISTDNPPFETRAIRAGPPSLQVSGSESTQLSQRPVSMGAPTQARIDHRQNLRERENLQEYGCSITDLVEDLVGAYPNTSQQRFCDNLLCMYRKFADPCDLLTAIKVVFLAPRDADVHLCRAKRQLRCLEILHSWVSRYPADFADSVVREQLGRMLKQLLNHPIYSCTVAAITHAIIPERPDVDREWAFSRAKRLSALSTNSEFLEHSTINAIQSHMRENINSSDSARKGQHLQCSGTNEPNLEDNAPLQTKDTNASRNLIAKYIGLETGGSLTLGPLTKPVWKQIRDFEPRDLALEITRIDAELLHHLEPRELIRHVSLTVVQAEESTNLINVKLMVFWFSRLASWVANVVIFRDKIQDRADVMRKLIALAWCLRRLNNYFSLAAVIAGLLGHNVYRLSQTRALIPPDEEKGLKQLEVLMNSSKGNAAYRLAWENSSGPRIPYFLMHRRDLLIVEETNTFVNGDSQRINWPKFQRMGDIVAETLQSKEQKYRLGPLNSKAYEWFFLYDLQDDDDLYARSRELEGDLLE